MPRSSRPPDAAQRGEVIRLPSRASLTRIRDGRSTNNLTEKQQEALALLLAGRGFAATAAALDLDESVILDWMSNDSDFDAALAAAQRRRRRLTQMAIERGAEKGAVVLTDLLNDPKAKHDIKVKAASVLLDRMRDISDEPPKAAGGGDPIGAALQRMSVSIPAGAAVALGVKKDAAGRVTTERRKMEATETLDGADPIDPPERGGDAT